MVCGYKRPFSMRKFSKAIWYRLDKVRKELDNGNEDVQLLFDALCRLLSAKMNDGVAWLNEDDYEFARSTVMWAKIEGMDFNGAERTLLGF